MSHTGGFKPLKPGQLNVEDIVFSPVKTMGNGGKTIYVNHKDSSLYIQPPELEVTFDSGNYYPNEKKPENGKYTVKVSLKEDDPDVKVFLDKMLEMDEFLKESGMKNSQNWFKKKNMTMDTIENVYNPIVKVSKDKETGEPDGKYPPSFQFKIAQWDGEIQCKFFDDNKEVINVNDPEGPNYRKVGITIPFEERMTIPHEGLFKRHTKVKVLLRCKSIWMTNGNFGCTWGAEQIRVKTPPGLESYAFLDDSEEEEVTEKIQGNFVDSSSDEEEGLSRQVSVAQ